MLDGRDPRHGPDPTRGAGADTAEAGRADEAAARGAGSHPRELDVLRLPAEGLSAAAISAELNYSQRTIKAMIQRILVRHGLRNRPHAVVYALRSKLL
ncbi:response regulator transcription factor [Streptomyces sp. NPDC056656]|uniref:response regulator transcription factor n=1 Tax=Streptomyces sp. NPDC056656 TaxID=3345895 RepID=UPI003694603D